MTYVDGEGVERYVRTNKSVISQREAKERWRKANLEKQRERNNKWRRDNPETQSASEKRWRKANPLTVRAGHLRHKHKRRLLTEVHKIDRIDAKFLTALRAAQNDACAYCLAPLFGSGELDHVVPITKGGTHVRTNLVLACTPCNRRKSNKLGWRVVSPSVGPQAWLLNSAPL